jgi:hypothetical protein
VNAEDDFGLRALELHFSVNGSETNVVSLFEGKGSITKSMSGTHTFFLEEYELEPGDFITYFARAKDARTASDSDIYFLEVRPFGKEYSQSQTSGMPGGGGGETDTILSRRQKEILAATWRLVRDAKSFDRKEYEENLKVVAESQKKLQEEAQSLSQRIVRRALTAGAEDFEKLSENLKQAIKAMTPAHQYLSDRKPAEAMKPEQTALQYLMRAESHFRDIQVAQGNNAGGAGNQSDAEELENLFELELDQLKNQYETLQQRQNRQARNEIDETSRRLQELARRQQQLNERNRQAASRQQSNQGGGSSGADQRALQEEAQKLARQLERLSRETQNEELMQASRRLQQAAKEMQNSQLSENSQNGQGIQALNRLNDARRMIDRAQDGSLNEQVRGLQEQAAELSRQQEQVQRDVEQLRQTLEGAGAGRTEDPRRTARRLVENKNELKRGVNDLQQGLHQAARDAARQNKQAGSRGLQSAANELKDSGLGRRIDQGRDMAMRGQLESAAQREQSIQEAISSVRDRIASAEKELQQASGNQSGTPNERLEQALNRAGDLVSELESLERRAQEAQRRGQQSQDRQGQQGQEGQEGQEGQQGAQGGSEQGEQSGEGAASGSSQGTPQGGQRQDGGGPAGGRDAVNFGDQVPRGEPRLTPDQIRQFEREFQLRQQEAQQLSRELSDRGDLAAQARELSQRMKNMPPARFLQDAEELARLRASIIEGFRDLELNLSKALNQIAARENIRLAKDEAIPEGYEKQVEDYYRALSRRPE